MRVARIVCMRCFSHEHTRRNGAIRPDPGAGRGSPVVGLRNAEPLLKEERQRDRGQHWTIELPSRLGRRLKPTLLNACEGEPAESWEASGLVIGMTKQSGSVPA